MASILEAIPISRTHACVCLCVRACKIKYMYVSLGIDGVLIWQTLLTNSPRFPVTLICVPNPPMDLLPDMQNCGLCMRRECRERFPRHRRQRKPLIIDPDMHHGTCVTHVPWCMSGSITRGGGENVPGIPGAGATRNFAYLARGPCPFIAPGETVEIVSTKMS